MDNPIRRLVRSKIHSLMALYNESCSVNHGPTIGTLREQYLTEFMKDIFPNKFLLKSGFITCSLSETISPQIDLVVCDKNSMPAFSLDDRVSILPIETILITIEVKSTIKSDDLLQMQQQSQIINTLIPCITSFSNQKEKVDYRIPSFIVSYNSTLSKESLKQWFQVFNNLTGICVIGKFSILRTNSGVSIYEDKNYSETLDCFGMMYKTLEDQLFERTKVIPLLGNYLSDEITKNIVLPNK